MEQKRKKITSSKEQNNESTEAARSSKQKYGFQKEKKYIHGLFMKIHIWLDAKAQFRGRGEMNKKVEKMDD